MHTDYEAQDENEDDWKKYDHADHEAGAAYYDEVAQTQGRVAPPVTPEPLDTHHLKLARRYMAEYEQRINDDRTYFSDTAERHAYEDSAYKQAMMHAAIAAAEAQTRQAEVAESMLEFVAELIDKTDIVNALRQWGYKQERAE